MTKDRLLMNDSVSSSSMRSYIENCGFYATMQTDGNFVIYNSRTFVPSNAVWSTQTHNKGHGPYKMVMQADGNLVLYDRNNHALWSSNTYNQGHAPHHVLLTSGGVLELYDSHHRKLWNSSNAPSCSSSAGRPHHHTPSIPKPTIVPVPVPVPVPVMPTPVYPHPVMPSPYQPTTVYPGASPYQPTTVYPGAPAPYAPPPAAVAYPGTTSYPSASPYPPPAAVAYPGVVPVAARPPRADTMTDNERIDSDHRSVITSENGQYHLVMQKDGNLVLYRGKQWVHQYAEWSTKTYNKSNGPFHCTVLSNGNFVVYDGYHRPLWESNTSMCGKPGPFYLQVTNYGSLNLTNIHGEQIWSTSGLVNFMNALLK